MARQLFERANAERALRGLAPLQWHDGLAAMAKNWSETMAATGQFVHRPKTARGGFQLPQACCWENIYAMYGGQMNVDSIHRGWMNSQGHRDNLLSPKVKYFGAGVSCGGSGSSYATQNFAADDWSGADGGPTPAQPTATPASAGLSC
jgi:uncharacterized protein YkwD